MTAVAFVWFFAYLVLAFGLITFVQSNWPDSMVGRTFGVLF